MRDYLAQYPTAKPNEIGPAVKAAHGLEVSPQMISMFKSKLRNVRKRRGRSPQAATVATGRHGRTSYGARFSIDDLVSAKKIALQVGGLDRAQQLFQALARLA